MTAVGGGRRILDWAAGATRLAEQVHLRPLQTSVAVAKIKCVERKAYIQISVGTFFNF